MKLLLPHLKACQESILKSPGSSSLRLTCLLAVQMGIFQVIYLGNSAEEAYQRLQPLQPFAPFRDASCGPPSFNLNVQHCIQVASNPYTAVSANDNATCMQLHLSANVCNLRGAAQTHKLI